MEIRFHLTLDVTVCPSDMKEEKRSKEGVGNGHSCPLPVNVLLLRICKKKKKKCSEYLFPESLLLNEQLLLLLFSSLYRA